MKAIFTKYQSWFFALLFALLLLVNKSFGQTATITFDFIGGTNSCPGESDDTYSGTSGTIVTVPTTGIPGTATITGISFTARYGVYYGSTTITFSLNGTSIGSLYGNTNSCLTGTISPISIPLFNKTGPNSLTITISGGFFPGVYNGIFTVNYTVPCPTITASATYSNVLCNGTSTGQIIVTGNNGTAPYMYSINNGANYQSSNTFNNLPIGTYKIRVKDNNGCESRSVQ
jgi:hypothetical protein